MGANSVMDLLRARGLDDVIEDQQLAPINDLMYMPRPIQPTTFNQRGDQP